MREVFLSISLWSERLKIFFHVLGLFIVLFSTLFFFNKMKDILTVSHDSMI